MAAFSALRVLVRAARPMGRLEYPKVMMEMCSCSATKVALRPFAQASSSGPYSPPRKSAAHSASSASETDSDLEPTGHRGESDFWRRKMRTFHSVLDVNKDGVLSFDDFNLLTNRFIDLGNMKEAECEKFRVRVKQLWVKRFGEVTPYNLVTVEQFLEDMHHVLNDKALVRHHHNFLRYLFRAVDKDQDGQIVLEEYKLLFDCLGLKHEDAVVAFRGIDSNSDGKITIKEFVKNGREFFLSEDDKSVSRYFFGPLVLH